jgi:hypothetical protein
MPFVASSSALTDAPRTAPGQCLVPRLDSLTTIATGAAAIVDRSGERERADAPMGKTCRRGVVVQRGQRNVSPNVHSSAPEPLRGKTSGLQPPPWAEIRKTCGLQPLPFLRSPLKTDNGKDVSSKSAHLAAQAQRACVSQPRVGTTLGSRGGPDWTTRNELRPPAQGKDRGHAGHSRAGRNRVAVRLKWPRRISQGRRSAPTLG